MSKVLLMGVVAVVVSAAHGTEGLEGDYNGDGVVDAADYVVWRKTDGSAEGYNTWRTNFGATGPSSPRPASPDTPSLSAIYDGATPSGNHAFTLYANQPTGGNPIAVEIGIITEGLLVQVPVAASSPFEVDDDITANSANGFLGYQKQEDTWYYRSQWTDANPGFNFFTSGVTEGYMPGPHPDALFISVGGGPFSQTQVPLLQIIVDPSTSVSLNPFEAQSGEVSIGGWFGLVASEEATYATFGDLVIPEPASLAVIALALLLAAAPRRLRSPAT
ncbi:MAG: hypothetical protein WD316_13305 [Phycisphaeraceae bacterium]